MITWSKDVVGPVTKPHLETFFWDEDLDKALLEHLVKKMVTGPHGEVHQRDLAMISALNVALCGGVVILPGHDPGSGWTNPLLELTQGTGGDEVAVVITGTGDVGPEMELLPMLAFSAPEVHLTPQHTFYICKR